MNPMTRWGDKGRYEGHDDDSTNTEEPLRWTIKAKKEDTCASK